MIKVGLIGLGYWGSKLRKYLNDNKNFGVIPVGHSDKEIKAIMNDSSLNSVVIATPNSTHYDLAKMALEHGKNVMCEKPLAFTVDECETLKAIAELYNLKLTVEYTFTFSKCLQQMVEYCKNAQYIRMDVQHLGRFGGGDVYWLLGSHMLSVLDMIRPLSLFNFEGQALLAHNNVTETGRIDCYSGDLLVDINISLNHPYKKVEITAYNNDNTVIYNPTKKPPLEVIYYSRPEWDVNVPIQKVMTDLDESNNLKYSVEHFYNVITDKEPSNLDRAIRVTKVLEDIGA